MRILCVEDNKINTHHTVNQLTKYYTKILAVVLLFFHNKHEELEAGWLNCMHA